MAPWRERREPSRAERWGGQSREAAAARFAPTPGRASERAEASCRESPGLECGGEGGDGEKPEPSTRKNATAPRKFPARLCFWQVPGGGASNGNRRGPGRPAADRAAPTPPHRGQLARGLTPEGGRPAASAESPHGARGGSSWHAAWRRNLGFLCTFLRLSLPSPQPPCPVCLQLYYRRVLLSLLYPLLLF